MTQVFAGIKPLTGKDWIALGVCVAVLVLIWLASRPPRPYAMRRDPTDRELDIAILCGVVIMCLVGFAAWVFMP